MNTDTMTPKERFMAFLSGQETDRLLCVPLILNHAAHAAGMTVSQAHRDGETLGKAHAASYRKYGQDLITIFSDTSLIAEAMGTKLYYSEDDAPRVQEPAVVGPNDAAGIVPPDPHQDGRLPHYLEAIRTANREVGEEVFVSCCFALPVTIAAALLGTDIFVKSLRKNPDLAHRLLKVSMQAALDFADAVIEAGGIPVPVDPVASCSVIGPRQYEEFAAPYTKPIIERIAQSGLPPVLHICGSSHLIWGQMCDTGAAVLSLDRVDLAEASRSVGERVCLLGNVAPAETLLYGTPETVDEQTRICIEKGAGNPKGYIVGSGCEVPLNTPPENIHAMMSAVRKYGRN
ncbi:MAG: uroporphyrinogen decarboxylase family protein [Armatimonadia bacterium]